MKYRTFEEALNFAIDREREAISVYDLFSRRAEKPATRAMFEALVAEERRHEQSLTGVKPEQLTSVKEKALAPAESTGPQINFDPDMDFVAAIKLAIQREEEAVELYQLLRDEADDPALKKLFGALVAQERGHRAKLMDEQDSIVLKDY